jgi:hypothetical protein
MLDGQAIVRIQSPLVAHHDSVPEPDVAVVPLGDYRREHPSIALLVIEVAAAERAGILAIRTQAHRDDRDRSSPQGRGMVAIRAGDHREITHDLRKCN